MKVRLVKGDGPFSFRKQGTTRSRPDPYPHGVQVLDFEAQLRRAGLPDVQQSMFSTQRMEGRLVPEIHVKFGEPFTDGQELLIPDELVTLRKEAHEGKQKKTKLAERRFGL